METAIWFSRHQPTGAQIEDAARMGYVLNVTATGTGLGSKDIAEAGDICAVVSALLGHCTEEHPIYLCSRTGSEVSNASPTTPDGGFPEAQMTGRKPLAIFGVFAAPILGQLARTADDIRQRGECREGPDVPCFAAWNVMRSVEGGKPTFTHKAFVGIGRLSQESLRWLK